LFTAVTVVLALTVGCNQLELEKSIAMESVFPSPNQTDVTIYYTVPQPPPGKVYVLWVLNPQLHQMSSAGQVPGGRNQTAKASVNFVATGAVVSIEDQPNPTTMSTTWALRVGSVTQGTQTPGVGPSPGSSGVTTPGVVTTPNVVTTPAVVTTPVVVTTPAAVTTPAVATTPAVTPGTSQ
jgi:hypothetical protein